MAAAVALAAAMTSSGACSPASFVVDRFDVAMHLTPDGHLEVHERFALRAPRGARSFERALDADRAESLEALEALVDGRSLPGEAIRRSGRTALRVTWPAGEAGERVQILEWRYRASGVLALHGRRGEFAWAALPAGRPYAIRTARLALTVPAGIARVGEWGVAESGWSVGALPDGMTANRGEVSPNETATLLAAVAIDPASVQEPRWQHDAEFARQLRPAFLAGGLFILVIGLGVVGLIRFEAATRAGPRMPNQDRSIPRQTAEALYTAGLVSFIFGFVVAAATALGRQRYGIWSMTIPASILGVALLFLLCGRRPRRRAG